MQHYYIVTLREGKNLVQARNMEDVKAHYNNVEILETKELTIPEVDALTEKMPFVKAPEAPEKKPQRTETLYLRNWEYNAARILGELVTIIDNNGGHVAYANTHPEMRYKPFDILYTLYNRTLSGAIREKKEWVDRLRKLDLNTAPAELELEKLEAVQAPPVVTRFKSWVSFVLDDYYYSLSLDSNPFFPAHYTKIKLQDNAYHGTHYMEELKKEDWLFDCFFGYAASPGDTREAAQLILNQLVNAAPSGEYVETRKTRVYNTYDNGYHYENIPTGPRRKTNIVFVDMEG